jgi:hypothetical protein
MLISSASSKWTPRSEEGAQKRSRSLLDRQQLERPAARAGECAREKKFVESRHCQQRKAPRQMLVRAYGYLERCRIRRKEARLEPQEQSHQQRDGSQSVTDPIGKPERINLVAAVEHDVGKTCTAEKHADHRSLLAAAPEGDQLARDQVRREVGLGEGQQLAERGDRVAVGTEIQRNKIRLPARQDRDGRRALAEMAAVVQLRQCRLDGAVAAVDHQHLGAHPGNGLQGFADLVGALHLIVKDVWVLGDITRRARIRKQRDAWPGHQLLTAGDRRRIRRNCAAACVAAAATGSSMWRRFDMILSTGPL